MAKVTGKGSVVQLEKEKARGKCRRWQLRVNCGLDPRTGKYRTRTRRFEGTYTQANKALREFVQEVENDRVQTGRADYTLEQWCERYVERRVLNKEIAASTAVRIRSNLKSVCAHLGHANLARITPTMVDDMYLAMLKGDTLSGRPSSGTHVNHIHATLSHALDQAVREGVISSNPCEKATPPRIDTKQRHAIEPEKVREFLGELGAGNDNDCAYLLAVCLGMRRGEVCGLSWGDVDFEGMAVHVRHSVDITNSLKGTKTKAGRRVLPMPGFVADVLRKHKEVQSARFDALNRERKRAGRPREELLSVTDNGPVIAGISGERLHPATLSKWWEGERASFGLEGVTFHELRHTFLTMLALEGVHPKVMQELAGHADPTMAMRVYAHVNLDAKRKAMDTLASSLVS